jgi:hypothetical protein
MIGGSPALFRGNLKVPRAQVAVWSVYAPPVNSQRCQLYAGRQMIQLHGPRQVIVRLGVVPFYPFAILEQQRRIVETVGVIALGRPACDSDTRDLVAIPTLVI